MTTPDTAEIREMKSKRSKCADVGNLDLSNVPESHETIWLQWGDNGGDDDTWCANNVNDEDVPYIRADLVHSLCDALDDLRADIETCTAKRDEWADRAMTELGNVLDLRAEIERLRKAAGVVSAVLQSERTRLGGQPFTGNWSIPQIGFRGTVDDALDMADAALAQKGAAP